MNREPQNRRSRSPAKQPEERNPSGNKRKVCPRCGINAKSREHGLRGNVSTNQEASWQGNVSTNQEASWHQLAELESTMQFLHLLTAELLFSGWSRIEVGDELLVGSEEGGFVGLEELTPTENMVFDDSQAELIEGPMVSNDEPAAKNKASKRKQPPGSDTPGTIQPVFRERVALCTSVALRKE